MEAKNLFRTNQNKLGHYGHITRFIVEKSKSVTDLDIKIQKRTSIRETCDTHYAKVRIIHRSLYFAALEIDIASLKLEFKSNCIFSISQLYLWNSPEDTAACLIN